MGLGNKRLYAAWLLLITAPLAAEPMIGLDEAADILDADYYLNLSGRLTAVRTQKSLVVEADENKRLLRGLYLTDSLRDQGRAELTRYRKLAALARGRDEIWFRIGQRFWRQGDLERAEQAWTKVGKRLPRKMQAEHRFMRSLLASTQKAFKTARQQLRLMPPSDPLTALAGFNLGVQELRHNQVSQGVKRLRRLAQQAERTDVRDRAHFALAMHYVKQRRQRQQAQDHLQQVRLEGGISDQALLLLGWYHFDAQDYAATLPPWEELKRRNPNNPLVWPALLGIALSKERQGAEQQALMDYYFALETYRDRIRSIDKALKSVRNGGFLSGLKRRTLFDGLPTNDDWILPHVYPQDRPELVFLQRVFVSHRFNVAVRAYGAQRFAHSLLKAWEEEVKNYRAILKPSKRSYIRNLPDQLKFIQQSHRRGLSPSSYEWVFDRKPEQDLKRQQIDYRLRQLIGAPPPGRRDRLLKGLAGWYGQATPQALLKTINTRQPITQKTWQQLEALEARFQRDGHEVIARKRKQMARTARNLAREVDDRNEGLEDEIIDQEFVLSELAAEDLLDQRRVLERLLLKAAQAVDRIHYEIFTRQEVDS